METKEIEKRKEDAVNKIKIKEILQEDKKKKKIKLERFERNWNPHRGSNWRLNAAKLRKLKKEGIILSTLRKIFGN